MLFLEELQYLKMKYPNAYEDADLFAQAYMAVAKRIQYVGPYHLWETGFCIGDATVEDIQQDCKNILNLNVNVEDDEQVEEAKNLLFNMFEEIFIEEYERLLQKAEKELEKEKQTTEL